MLTNHLFLFMINTQPPPQVIITNFIPVKSSVTLNIKAIQKVNEARNTLKMRTRGFEWASAQTQTKMWIDHCAMWILM